MKNELENLVPRELIQLAGVCRALMMVINARLFTLLGMMLSALAFGWCLWEPNWIRCAAACGFAVLVYWPAYRLELNRVHSSRVEKGEENGETSL